MLVVVADDSSVMRRIVIRTLRQAGFDDVEIVEASDGAELVRVATSVGPDLVLSDWNMPQLTGIEALRRLRTHGCHVPFGFITSEGSDAMRRQASDAGAAFLVAKPFTADLIRDAIATCV